MNYFIWHHTGDKQETPKTMKGKIELSETRLSSSCSNSLVYMFLQNRMVCFFFQRYTPVLGGILLITVGSGSLNISELENHHF